MFAKNFKGIWTKIDFIYAKTYMRCQWPANFRQREPCCGMPACVPLASGSYLIGSFFFDVRIVKTKMGRQDSASGGIMIGQPVNAFGFGVTVYTYLSPRLKHDHPACWGVHTLTIRVSALMWNLFRLDLDFWMSWSVRLTFLRV